VSAVRRVPREFRQAYFLAMEAGWEVTVTGKDHLKWKPPDGPPVFTAGTPSNWRGTRNALVLLRNAGLADLRVKG
jgi:hypothetical protein